MGCGVGFLRQRGREQSVARSRCRQSDTTIEERQPAVVIDYRKPSATLMSLSHWSVTLTRAQRPARST